VAGVTTKGFCRGSVAHSGHDQRCEVPPVAGDVGVKADVLAGGGERLIDSRRPARHHCFGLEPAVEQSSGGRTRNSLRPVGAEPPVLNGLGQGGRFLRSAPAIRKLLVWPIRSL